MVYNLFPGGVGPVYRDLDEAYRVHFSHQEEQDTPQRRLYEDVRIIIDQHGGTIDRPLLATLFLAQVE